MSARWWRLSELVALSPGVFTVSDTLNGAGNWVATPYAGWDGQPEILDIALGAMAPQFQGGAVRLHLISDAGSSGDSYMYPVQAKFVDSDAPGGYNSTPFGTATISSADYGEPFTLTPNPRTAQNPIPATTANLSLVVSNSAAGTNGWSDPVLELDIQFFGDFSLGTFWTDFVNTRAGE